MARKSCALRSQSGESIRSITDRLLQAGLIPDSDLFADYLIYSGLDTQIQAGKHTLNNSMNSLEIAREILDATPEDVTFGLLAGWRAEEVAAIIPSSGLSFTSEQLMDAILQPPESLDLSFWGEPESLRRITCLWRICIPTGSYTGRLFIYT